MKNLKPIVSVLVMSLSFSLMGCSSNSETSSTRALFDTRKEAEKVLNNNGVLVIFPSGRISTKKNLKKLTKADDGQWKQWVSKLILKTKCPVLPIYFDGQNSQWYHMANKLGLTFRYSLCMYELKRKIGDDIYMYFGSLISYENLAKIGDIRDITKYLRAATYSLDPHLNNN